MVRNAPDNEVVVDGSNELMFDILARNIGCNVRDELYSSGWIGSWFTEPANKKTSTSKVFRLVLIRQR